MNEIARTRMSPERNPPESNRNSPMLSNPLKCANLYDCIRYNSRKTSGMMALLMQYFQKGFVVAARKRKCRLKRMKLLMFQLIMNMPIATPTIAKLTGFTSPRYSGARYKASAPNVFMKLPLIVLNRMNQKSNNTWYLRKCRNSNCIGKEW